jgi:uncharacterized surface protein with fasciclin (FAS1) repeats
MKLLHKIMALSIVLSSATCSDDASDRFFSTFEEKQITSYLEANPEMYSEFSKWLNVSGIADLLNAYGAYTCFAPTNEAISNYYVQKEITFEQMTLAEIREITFNHIIGQTIMSVEFPVGVLSTATLLERFLYISYGKGENLVNIFVNEHSKILWLDQAVHNGVIHTIDAVLEPSKIQLPDVIADDTRFSLFGKALFATGMSDSLRLMNDESYVTGKVTGNGGKTYLYPPFRKYGYTAFMESDSLFNLNEIHDLEDLKTYAAKVYDSMYPADKNVTDLTDRRNSLNRFVSYHLLDRMQASNEFVSAEMEYYFVPGTTIYEYIEPLCPNTLIEVQLARADQGTVVFNKRKTGMGIRIIDPNNEADNGVYHEIDKIMVYDETMENDVLNKRLRIEIASMFSELTTNKLRGPSIGDVDRYVMPPGYLKNISFAEGTLPHYFGCKCWSDYLGDEFLLLGKYDFTLRTPPIPAGTYEVRLCYVGNDARGVAQIYFDGEPCGIPLNMSIWADNPKIGYISDSQTDDNGIENDKMLRNRGYVKGPNSVYIENQRDVARNVKNHLRRILVTKTFDNTSPHTLRVKSVEERTDRQYNLDYLEFVPVAYLEKEGRD